MLIMRLHAIGFFYNLGETQELLEFSVGTEERFKKGTEYCYKNNQRINKINVRFPGANQSMTDRFM